MLHILLQHLCLAYRMVYYHSQYSFRCMMQVLYHIPSHSQRMLSIFIGDLRLKCIPQVWTDQNDTGQQGYSNIYC